MSTFMRYALITEAFFNITSSVVFLFRPEACLSYVISTSSVPPSSATLLQISSCLVLALTVPIIQCIPEKPRVAEQRVLTYRTLAGGEVFIIGLLLWKALNSSASGFSSKTLLGAVGVLTPTLLLRFWVLSVNPKILGHGWEEVQKKNM